MGPGPSLWLVAPSLPHQNATEIRGQTHTRPQSGTWWIGALSHARKGCGFDPQSGSRREAMDQCFSSLSLPLTSTNVGSGDFKNEKEKKYLHQVWSVGRDGMTRTGSPPAPPCRHGVSPSFWPQRTGMSSHL